MNQTLISFLFEFLIMLKLLFCFYSCFSVCPNKYIGVVAKHGKESVEKIRFSSMQFNFIKSIVNSAEILGERDLVVTCADDKRIKFWSLRSLLVVVK